MGLTCCNREWTAVPEDSRFGYRWLSAVSGIDITFVNADGRRVEQHVSNVDQAYDFMLQQARPHGSLRIGDLIRTVTTSVGISACAACKARQLKYNTR